MQLIQRANKYWEAKISSQKHVEHFCTQDPTKKVCVRFYIYAVFGFSYSKPKVQFYRSIIPSGGFEHLNYHFVWPIHLKFYVGWLNMTSANQLIHFNQVNAVKVCHKFSDCSELIQLSHYFTCEIQSDIFSSHRGIV